MTVYVRLSVGAEDQHPAYEGCKACAFPKPAHKTWEKVSSCPNCRHSRYSDFDEAQRFEAGWFNPVAQEQDNGSLIVKRWNTQREVRAEVDWAYQPGQFDAVRARTLLLAGAESSPAQQEATQRAAAAIPDAHVRTLDGHSHIAHRIDPGMVAAIVCEFVTS